MWTNNCFFKRILVHKFRKYVINKLNHKGTINTNTIVMNVVPLQQGINGLSYLRRHRGGARYLQSQPSHTRCSSVINERHVKARRGCHCHTYHNTFCLILLRQELLLNLELTDLADLFQPLQNWSYSIAMKFMRLILALY